MNLIRENFQTDIYMVSLHCVEESCTPGLQALGGRASKYLKETGEVPGLEASVGF